ncbi:MAG: dehydrogenase [Myxococcaceae bacterium]|nr:dehydrogenase [Myxococcaceae bacterium]
MHIVIVGGGYAGLACALRLARRSAGKAAITLVSGSERFVERIRLHEVAAGKGPGPRSLHALVRGTAIQLRIGWVQELDLAARTIGLGGERIAYDRLVLALGSRSDDRAVPGLREYAYTLDDTQPGWLAASLPALAARAGHVLVVGAGLTGIETASELASVYPQLRITLATAGVLAPTSSNKARAHVRAFFARRAVTVREQLRVHRLAERTLHAQGESLPFDLCIWTAGFRAPELPRESGLATNERGQVWVDAQLRSISHPDVYVAGDLAIQQAPRGARMPLGCKSAFPSGFHVAENLARVLRGQPERPFHYREVPYLTSLGRHDATVQLPSGRTLTGRFAARLKELVCRTTMLALHFERRLGASYGMFASRPLALSATSRGERG